MSLNPSTGNPFSVQVPVIRVDHCGAAKAYILHAALMRALRDEPLLADDELFNDFKAKAFQRFTDAFEVGA